MLQLNLAAEKAEGISTVDTLVDQRLLDIGNNEDTIVIDSRTAWHWIPQSFKVYLDLDLTTAAQRILAAMTPERIAAEHIPDDPDEYGKVLQNRLDSETRRYKKIYNIDPSKITNYDLVIDTKTTNLEQTVQMVLEKYKEWQEDQTN